MKLYRAILIDPDARSISEMEWTGALPELHAMVGAETLDHFKLAMFDDRHLDCGWTDDSGLSRGEPVHAFLLPTSRDPIAGKCAIIGADERGETADCQIPLAILLQDVTWLGLILPEVHWEHTATGSRSIVIYERVKQ